MTIPPEHDHGHAHATGMKWLDIVIAVSVVFISVLSLVVSIQHGKTMERMVDQNEKMVVANTMPILNFGASNIDTATGGARFSLYLKNGGVGPAVIDWFEIRYRGVSYGSVGALLRACCAAFAPSGERLPDGLYYSNISGTILPAREIVEPIVITPKGPAPIYQALEQARPDIGARACYCSVLDECWLADFERSRARRVAACRVPAGVAPW